MAGSRLAMERCGGNSMQSRRGGGGLTSKVGRYLMKKCFCPVPIVFNSNPHMFDDALPCVLRSRYFFSFSCNGSLAHALMGRLWSYPHHTLHIVAE